MNRKSILTCTATTALMLASAATGAERTVLVEDFNATWCGPCIPVGQALNNLQNDYADDLIVIQVHQADAYTITWGNQRASFYGVPGYPTVWFDGVTPRVGSSGSQTGDYNAMQSILNTRWADATDVTVQNSVIPLGGNQYRLEATIGIEAGGTAKTMRIHMAQALDNTPSGSHYVNCLIQAMNYETISLNPGETTVVEHIFTLTGDSASNEDDVRFLAWAQANSSSSPAEVFNADYIGTEPINAIDRCSDAATLVQGEAMPFDSTWATDNGVLESGCDPIESDVWFRFVAQCDDDITISVCDADFDVMLAAYWILCPTSDDTAVACGDDNCKGGASITFTPQTGFEYKIRVGGRNGETGTGSITWECEDTGTVCSGDINEDGNVDTVDLLGLLAAWGPCPGGCPEDFDGNENVDTVDLLTLLAGWGICP